MLNARLKQSHALQSVLSQLSACSDLPSVAVCLSSALTHPLCDALLLAVAIFHYDTLLPTIAMAGVSMPFASVCFLLLLFTSTSFVQLADAQEFVEKTCVQAFGNSSWPDWVPQCHNNGTCMLYYPYEDDPYPSPYCICEPPYTGMACEAIDWNADVTMVAGTYAGIGAAVFFLTFAVLVVVVCICYRKKVQQRRAEKLGHKDGKQMETNRYDLKGLSGTFQIEPLKSDVQTPTTATTTIYGISDLDENGNDRHAGNGQLISGVDEEALVSKRTRAYENATPPRRLPSRAASVRASQFIHDSDTLKFIDEDGWDEMDSAGNPVTRSPSGAIATSTV